MLTYLRRIRVAGFIAGFIAALVLTGGGAAAYAANGGSLLIGRSNAGTALTTLSNSGGTALRLNSKAGTAPLAVNRTNKVTGLHADYLDGYSETSFARTTGQTGVIIAEGVFIDTDDDLINDALEANAQCPAGTRMTGGGADNWTGELTVINSPGLDGRSWDAASFADESVNFPDDLLAYVVCYNPRGAVPGAMTATAARAASEAKIVQRLAAEHARR